MFKQDDEIICIDDVYGGSANLLLNVMTKFNISVKMVDFSNLENFENVINPNKTKVKSYFIITTFRWCF